MEPGDWKYAVVLAVMVGGLVLVAYSVPKMDEAEARFKIEMRAAQSSTTQAEFQFHVAAASAAERDRLFFGSMGTLGAFGALIALLSLFFIGIRGPEGRGGMSRQAAREELGAEKAARTKQRKAATKSRAKGDGRDG